MCRWSGLPTLPLLLLDLADPHNPHMHSRNSPKARTHNRLKARLQRLLFIHGIPLAKPSMNIPMLLLALFAGQEQNGRFRPLVIDDETHIYHRPTCSSRLPCTSRTSSSAYPPSYASCSAHRSPQPGTKSWTACSCSPPLSLHATPQLVRPRLKGLDGRTTRTCGAIRFMTLPVLPLTLDRAVIGVLASRAPLTSTRARQTPWDRVSTARARDVLHQRLLGCRRSVALCADHQLRLL
jgi:hypothetical protein